MEPIFGFDKLSCLREQYSDFEVHLTSLDLKLYREKKDEILASRLYLS